MPKRREFDLKVVLWTTRELIRRVDLWRSPIHGLSRAAAIRNLIKVGLEHELMWESRGPGPSEKNGDRQGPRAARFDSS